LTGHVTIPVLEALLRYLGPYSPRVIPQNSRAGQTLSIVLNRHTSSAHVLLLNIVHTSVVYSVTHSWHGAYINTEGEPFDLEDSQLCHNLSSSPNIYYYKANSITVRKQMQLDVDTLSLNPTNTMDSYYRLDSHQSSAATTKAVGGKARAPTN
jgi:hypothetical protein